MLRTKNSFYLACLLGILVVGCEVTNKSATQPMPLILSADGKTAYVPQCVQKVGIGNNLSSCIFNYKNPVANSNSTAASVLQEKAELWGGFFNDYFGWYSAYNYVPVYNLSNYNASAFSSYFGVSNWYQYFGYNENYFNPVPGTTICNVCYAGAGCTDYCAKPTPVASIPCPTTPTPTTVTTSPPSAPTVTAVYHCAGGPVSPKYAFSSAASMAACKAVIASFSHACLQDATEGPCTVSSAAVVDNVSPANCICSTNLAAVGTWY